MNMLAVYDKSVYLTPHLLHITFWTIFYVRDIDLQMHFVKSEKKINEGRGLK